MTQRPDLLVVLTLAGLLLSACGTSFGNRTELFSGYSKPGVSSSVEKKEFQDCVYATSGPQRNAAIQELRAKECLRQKGFSR